MSKQEFLKAREDTKQFLKESNIKHHMFYGPTTDKYWEQNIKILFINMEPYGYKDLVYVNRETLQNWLYDVGNTGTRTVRYSLSFIKTLFDCIENNINIEQSSLRTAYRNIKVLEEVLDRITYWNIRPTSNIRKEQNFVEITKSGTGNLSQYIYKEMLSLDPNIIIIGGDAGLIAFNNMWDTSIRYKDNTEKGGIIIQSIQHPSIPNYNEYVQAIKNISVLTCRST